MRGLIIYNTFLFTEKFSEQVNMLQESASKFDTELDALDNSGINVSLTSNGFVVNDDKLKSYDFFMFWDKDIKLFYALETYAKKHNILCFNSSESILTCDDKSKTALRIAEWNEKAQDYEKINIPETIIIPMTYDNIGYNNFSFIKNISKKLSYPLVLKESFGSFGAGVYLINNDDEFEERLKKIGGKSCIAQKFVKTSFGRDIRLQVVGDKVVASMLRISQNNDFRANVTNGGKAYKYEPTENEIKLALNACKALNLQIAGVDLMFSQEGKEADILCEINANAHFKVISDISGINVSDKIIQYIINTVNENK